MMDVTAFIAAMTVMKNSEYPVTNTINTSIFNPVPHEHIIEFIAKIRKHGKRLIVINVKVYDITSSPVKIISEGLITKSILDMEHKPMKNITSSGDKLCAE